MNEITVSVIHSEINEIQTDTQRLILELLRPEDYTQKHNARLTLVKMGRKIIPQLHKQLSSSNGLLRKEVAKVVELVSDKRSIPFLITLLDDPDFDIRWIAAEGLIKIGRKSIIPILKSIRGGKSSLMLDKRAHHVLDKILYENEKIQLESLMHSLDNYHETGETAPVEALKALKKFKFNS
jgi:HEAT repeat protein